MILQFPLWSNRKNIKNERFFSITSENDLYSSGADQNYTNGIILKWFETKNENTSITKQLKNTLPFIKSNKFKNYSYSIGQNLYTPENIESFSLDPKDRPWAGFLYGSIAIHIYNKSFIDEYELTLGLIGSSAMGKQTQKIVHKAIKSPTPNGWDYQLENELGLMFSKQRKFHDLFSVSTMNGSFSFSPHLGYTIGNIYTFINTGGVLKFSTTNTRWQDKPLLVKPSIPGTGYFKETISPGFDFFVGLETRAIAGNIFLDGNTFQESHSVKKKKIVADISLGTSFVYKKTRISYATVLRTKEFEHQVKNSVFGAIGIVYKF